MVATTTSCMNSVLLTGDESAWSLVHRAIAHQAAHGPSPWVVDCGGVFNPYAVARRARHLGTKPEAVLANIRICRAFTAYQELQALRRVAALRATVWLYLLNPWALRLAGTHRSDSADLESEARSLTVATGRLG